MKKVPEQSALNRQSSHQHYHTFDTPPPKSRGRPNSGDSGPSADSSQHHGNDSPDHPGSETPLPKRQMAVLAMIALSEQTALNSFSPYLPDMASSFPEVNPDEVGVYVGSIASAFALAQFLTNFFWGWLSDRVGRKPVILLGTILTAACFVAFGFCTRLWQAIVVQALIGVVNGNQGLVSTCLGEITDRTNQSRVFTYLPVLYGIGGVTGPLLGGLLIFEQNPFNKKERNPFPYLAPNLVSAAILLVDFILTSIFLEESHQEAVDNLPRLKQKVHDLFSWLWQFTAFAKSPTYLHSHYRPLGYYTRDSHDHDDGLPPDTSPSPSHDHQHLRRADIFQRDTILILVTYLLFAFSNVSFNSLYPVFAQAPEPLGRDLDPSEIGLTQGFSGVVTIVFQILIFGKLRDKMGNKWTYRAGLLGFVVSFALMPLVGYTSGSRNDNGTSRRSLVVIELCAVLLIKTISTIGGLTSALLLITNCAPNHAVLGAINGLAQMLSAGGRTIGPFLSGGLFSLAAKSPTHGALLAFMVFSVTAFIGFLASLGIRGRKLEAGGAHNENDPYKSDDEEHSRQ